MPKTKQTTFTAEPGLVREIRETGKAINGARTTNESLRAILAEYKRLAKMERRLKYAATLTANIEAAEVAEQG